MKLITVTSLFALVAGGAVTLQAQPAQLSGTTRTELQRHDLSTAGREVIQAKVGIAPGAEAALHKHPGEEIVYVLEGSLEYHLDGRPPVTLRPGEVLFVPAGTPHSVRNVGSEAAVELATYVVEKGKPLLVPVK